MSRLFIVVALIVALAGCASSPDRQEPAARVQHIVLCWLKEPGNEGQRQTIIDVTKSFRDIPGVLSVSVGEVVASERAIVDDSFDVGLILTFGSVEKMQQYLNHPEHKQAVKTVLMPLVSRIQVYDYIER